MTNTLKWFSRPVDDRADCGFAQLATASDTDDDVQDAGVLPAHVQEFFDLKTAAGF